MLGSLSLRAQPLTARAAPPAAVATSAGGAAAGAAWPEWRALLQQLVKDGYLETGGGAVEPNDSGLAPALGAPSFLLRREPPRGRAGARAASNKCIWLGPPGSNPVPGPPLALLLTTAKHRRLCWSCPPPQTAPPRLPRPAPHSALTLPPPTPQAAPATTSAASSPLPETATATQ